MQDSNDQPPPPLAVTSVGMATSLSDYQHGCPAALAGVEQSHSHTTLVHAWPDNPMFDDEAPEPVTIHPCPLNSNDDYCDRLSVLLEAALTDLFEHLRPDPTVVSFAVFIGLSDAPPEGIQRPELIAALTQQLEIAFAQSCLSSIPSQVEFIFRGSCSLATSIEQAREYLASTDNARCFIGSIDTLITCDVLSNLLKGPLLATPTMPIGFFAGEAAVLIELQPADAVSQKHAMGYVHAVHSVSGATPCTILDRDNGARLTQAIRAVLMPEPDMRIKPDFIIGQFNGSDKIAYEWGLCQSRLNRMFEGAEDWHTALTFGETGATAGALSLAIATWRFSQPAFAHEHTILCWQYTPRGLRSACVITRVLNYAAPIQAQVADGSNEPDGSE
ncbi:Uncharacterised protein [BD1-7 clade bacterium]|uniref:Beta-ketoacyl synthase N-terminal domain-containing protein n=1 Tax=BD1-7 clade bacterium TaxID=2029982 RepID=A0A5S9QXK4_9GAMM|nr:Uncharacterised protein [BD1-7 clade bacterium]